MEKIQKEIWSTITTNQGIRFSFRFFNRFRKDVFQTAFELNQAWIVELSGDRTPYISQAQSINYFYQPMFTKRTTQNSF